MTRRSRTHQKQQGKTPRPTNLHECRSPRVGRRFKSALNRPAPVLESLYEKGQRQKGKTMSSVCEYIALDTETTGLSHKNGDRVIEIGAVKLDPLTGEVGDEFHRYVNPGIPIPPAVTKIHGITDEMLADKPSFAEIAEELEEFVKGAHVVIHNAQFDVGFLSAEQKKAK